MRAKLYLTACLCLLSAIGSRTSFAQATAESGSDPVLAEAGLTVPVIPAVKSADMKITLVVSTNSVVAKQTDSNEAASDDSNAATEEKKPATGLIGGALMLCGGGPLPDALFSKFFELGQAHEGSLVIIPSASGRADAGDFAGPLSEWKGFAWNRVEIVHAQDRKQAETNENLVEPLKRATAVWIAGGDQRRLAERYLGTPVEREIQQVVHRGGIVGGTSAGSAIASRVMISGGRQKPVIASGLDLLPGSIIDMHFSQRKRYERLASAVEQHPDRVGIGIDEGTGLLVSSDEARVFGTGSVYVYPRREKAAQKSEPMRFESGSAFRFMSSAAR